MDIVEATRRYETWLRDCLPFVKDTDVEYKHQQMAGAAVPFLRATFYRWAARWVALCPDLASAPMVLGVGDLHVENYGTWRDAEGRLVWGINDFDEATNLPYPADLVRLVTSAALASAEDHLSLSVKEAAEAVMAGYEEGLTERGEPFVLADRHDHLRRLAASGIRDPVRFWDKLRALPRAGASTFPIPEAVEIVVAALPGPVPWPQLTLHSRRSGLGSLGRPRLVALRDWQGGPVAREVKAVVPSAWDWALDRPAAATHYSEVLDQAVRGADPYTAVRGRWLVRRLAPDSARIELADIPAERDEKALLHSMGYEVANVHLGTPGGCSAVLDDLAGRGRRHPEWLAAAAQRMAADTQSDWTQWRSSMP